MDITLIFTHIGYVFCFWGVWKVLDVSWNLLRIDAFINAALERESDIERQVAGKLSYFNKIRETDEKKLKTQLNELAGALKVLTTKLTPDMDDNLRSTVYGLHERLKLATDGLKFDHELAKEVEKLRKKVHELNKNFPDEVPCYLPVNPDIIPQGTVKIDEDTKKSMIYMDGAWKEIEETTKKGGKKKVAAKTNPYIPQSLAVVKGAAVATKTNIKQGALGESLKYTTPHQVMLDNIKREEYEYEMLSGKTTSSKNKVAAKKS